jgi:hypothetical protein
VVVVTVARRQDFDAPLPCCQDTTVCVHRNIMTKLPVITKGMLCRRGRRLGGDADDMWKNQSFVDGTIWVGDPGRHSSDRKGVSVVSNASAQVKQEHPNSYSVLQIYATITTTWRDIGTC